jgi:hypothetical protein
MTRRTTQIIYLGGLLAIVVLALAGVWRSIALPRGITDEHGFLQTWQVTPGEAGVLFYTVLNAQPGHTHALYVAHTDGEFRKRPELDLEQIRGAVSIEVTGHGIWQDPDRVPQYFGKWQQIYDIAATERRLAISVTVEQGAFSAPVEIGLSRRTITIKQLGLENAMRRQILLFIFSAIGSVATCCLLVLVTEMRCSFRPTASNGSTVRGKAT